MIQPFGPPFCPPRQRFRAGVGGRQTQENVEYAEGDGRRIAKGFRDGEYTRAHRALELMGERRRADKTAGVVSVFERGRLLPANPEMKYLIFFLLSATAVDQPKLPPLLEKALRGLPGLRLLDPSVDLVGEYTVNELKEFGHWPPWVVMDVDRDGRRDVGAVVVKPGATPEFGVIAVHARTPTVVRWVAPLGTEAINGVAKGSAGPDRDKVTPLYCIECDSNSWYRWSGRSYEAELHAVGEQLLSADQTTYRKDQVLGLFAKPSRDSKFLFSIGHCTEAIVRRVAGSEKDRWYFVETKGGGGLRGWIPSSFVAGSGECIA